jgi:hypothetical protein
MGKVALPALQLLTDVGLRQEKSVPRAAVGKIVQAVWDILTTTISRTTSVCLTHLFLTFHHLGSSLFLFIP